MDTDKFMRHDTKPMLQSEIDEALAAQTTDSRPTIPVPPPVFEEEEYAI